MHIAALIRSAAANRGARRIWLACLLTPATVFADPLAPLIDEALRANAKLHAYEQQWRAAQRRVEAAQGLEDPMIGADIERASTRLDDYRVVEYTASQRLPAWGLRRARVEAARLRAEAAAFRFLEAGRDLRADVVEAAWNLWLANRRLETIRKTAELLADLTQSVRARYEAGQAMSADLIRAQMEQVRMTNEAARLRRERDAALAALNAKLNAAPDAPRDVAALQPPDALPFSREQYLARARPLLPPRGV
jgi:outer membrane protein TolC